MLGDLGLGRIESILVFLSIPIQHFEVVVVGRILHSAIFGCFTSILAGTPVLPQIPAHEYLSNL